MMEFSHERVIENELLSNSLKEEGNNLFAANNYSFALLKYSEAIRVKESAVLLSNRSFCYLKLEMYQQARIDADSALALDPTYIKGYYRRASANFALENYKVFY